MHHRSKNLRLPIQIFRDNRSRNATSHSFLNKTFKMIFWSDPEVLPLSSPQPDFKRDGGGSTFSGCLLLHRLIVTGQTDELVRRKREIVPALLSHTCEYGGNKVGWDKVRLKLKMIEV